MDKKTRKFDDVTSLHSNKIQAQQPCYFLTIPKGNTCLAPILWGHFMSMLSSTNL